MQSRNSYPNIKVKIAFLKIAFFAVVFSAFDPSILLAAGAEAPQTGPLNQSTAVIKSVVIINSADYAKAELFVVPALPAQSSSTIGYAGEQFCNLSNYQTFSALGQVNLIQKTYSAISGISLSGINQSVFKNCSFAVGSANEQISLNVQELRGLSAIFQDSRQANFSNYVFSKSSQSASPAVLTSQNNFILKNLSFARRIIATRSAAAMPLPIAAVSTNLFAVLRC